MIQSQNTFNLSINRLEVQMSELINTIYDRNEQTLPYQCLTIPDISYNIDLAQESRCFESFIGNSNQDSISS